jgi:hypothetical protein
MLTCIFILILNNGESYEDKDHWNSGIYKSLEDARQAGYKTMPKNSWEFEVEEWDIIHLVHTYEFSK